MHDAMLRVRPMAVLVITACVCIAPAAARAQEFTPWSPPTSLGPVVNSSALDGCPAISRDGLSLYFATNRVGGQLDIYVTQRDSREDPWGTPRSIGAVINEPGSNEYCPALSRDGHLLFFASNRAGGCGGVDIYVSHRQNKRDDFAWDSPQNLGCIVNSASDEFGPNYYETEAGTPVLYFNSNRPGGIGGQDLYVTEGAEDGAFGIPTPVFELNSVSNDQQPAVRRDGLEIIFTSNRAGGLGLTDLWQATRSATSDPWSTPVNLESPMNSTAGDARPALSWEGTELYFGSGRTGGLGSDDLYVATRTKTSAP